MSVWLLAKRAKVEMRVELRLLRNDVVLQIPWREKLSYLAGRSSIEAAYRDRATLS